MTFTIPTRHRRILFQSRKENPKIVQARNKNFLTAVGTKMVALDAEVEGQEYNKTVLGGSQGEEYGNE